MTESNDGGKKGLTRRDFGKAAGVAVVSAGLAALAGCLPNDEGLVKEVDAVKTAEAQKGKAEAVSQAAEIVAKETSKIAFEQKKNEVEKKRADLQTAIKKELMKLNMVDRLMGVEPVGGNTDPTMKIRVTITERDGIFLRRLPLVSPGTEIFPLTFNGKTTNAMEKDWAPAGMCFEVKMNEPGEQRRSIWLAVRPQDLELFSQISIPSTAKPLSAGEGNSRQEYVFFCAVRGDSSFIGKPSRCNINY